jgi:hypothetical protein
MDRSAEKITNGRLVYRLLTGTNGKTRFAMTARRAGIADKYGCIKIALYQNRAVSKS